MGYGTVIANDIVPRGVYCHQKKVAREASKIEGGSGRDLGTWSRRKSLRYFLRGVKLLIQLGNLIVFTWGQSAPGALTNPNSE
jgi:hypothetical protein